MKPFLLFVSFAFVAAELFAAPPKVEEIIARLDRQQNMESQIITYSMTIHGKRASRTVEGKSWIVGDQKSFTLYTAPAREKGSKMLKLGDKLWTYYPKADRVVSISGHMLRRSVMGSDMSYEDMMENRTLEESYHAFLDGEEVIDGKNAYKITLTAKTPDIAYQKMKLWVDQDKWLILRQELYAASGKLLKEIVTLEAMKTTRGWYIKHMRFKDVLKQGKGTEFYIKEALFDQKIPKRRFSKGALRR